MTKKSFAIRFIAGVALFLLGIVEAKAQENTLNEFQEEALVTDRPDFTESALTVPVGRIQVETGLSYSRSGAERQMVVGDDTLVRIAAGKKAEVRLGVPSYLITRNGEKARGLDDIFLGTKLVLSSREDQPVALLLGTTLPTGSRRVAEHRYQPEAVIATSRALSEGISLGVNLGYAHPSDGGRRFNQIFGSASLGFAVSKKVAAFTELFAFNRTEAGGRNQKYIDGGFTYLANPNLQFDIRAGVGLNNHVHGPDYFYGVGVARRF